MTLPPTYSGIVPEQGRTWAWMRRGVVVVIAGFILVSLVLIRSYPLIPLQGNLFSQTAGTDPTKGIFISKRYTAQPRERGSVVVQAGMTLTNLEALDLVLLVDPARAAIQRVRRPGGMQSFSMAMDRPSPGVVRVALVGAPKTFASGAHLLDVELELASENVNKPGDVVDVRMIGVSYLVNTTQVLTVSSDGKVTTVGAVPALVPPAPPAILDVEPNVVARFRDTRIIVRGQSFPSAPTVTIGPRLAKVVSSSATEIVVEVPTDLDPGTYPLSVGSVLAEEEIVLSVVPGAGAPVDILEDLLFFEFNPVLKLRDKVPAQPVVLWIPIYNPLGSTVDVTIALDLSAIGGLPNVVITGQGTPAPGREGVVINWFRVPVPQALASSIPAVTRSLDPSLVVGGKDGGLEIGAGLPTDRDYPISIRVQNGALTRDEFIATLSFRSTVTQGAAPIFGDVHATPAVAELGDEVEFFVQVTDADGIDTVRRVILDLRPIGGREVELSSTLPVPVGSKSAVFTLHAPFRIPRGTKPGTYDLPLRAVDERGNESTDVLLLAIVSNPPEFVGRLEAFPSNLVPGATVSFFAEIKDEDGAQDVAQVTVDLINLGGSVQSLQSTLKDISTLGTLPIVYTTTFTAPKTRVVGSYVVVFRAIDRLGQFAEKPLTVNVVATSLGDAPIFSGKKLAQPGTVAAGDDVEFSVDISDAQGGSTVTEVSIDLRDLRGGVQDMRAALGKPSQGPTPTTYIARYTLPSGVPSGSYNVTVRAIDENGNAAQTTIPITVSAQSVRGSSPQIVNFIISPPVIPPDGKTPFRIQVDVDDPDGIDADAVSVLADLAPIGSSRIPLQEQTTTEGESRLGTFGIEVKSIPTHIRAGGYDIAVEARDRSGRRSTRNVRINVGTVLGGDAPRIISARFVPEVIAPGALKGTSLFVEVEDTNGHDTLTVFGDLTLLRGKVDNLKRVIAYGDGTFSTRNTFSLDEVKVPGDLPQGTYDIPLTVTDRENNVIRGSARLRVERSSVEGHAPSIDVATLVQDPRAFPNNGDPSGTLNVIVRDQDDDVQTVLVNFRSLARAPSVAAEDKAGEVSLFCGSSQAIACMRRSVPVSPTSRWFVLEDVAVPPSTPPSSEPYRVQLTALDAEGNTDVIDAPLVVGAADAAEVLATTPRIIAAVPVGPTEMELALSVPLASESIDRTGSQFIIRHTLNAHVQFSVRQVSWDTTRRLLYVHHDQLRPGEAYTLSTVSPAQGGVSPLLSAYGTPFPEGPGSHVTFRAFQGATPPQIVRVQVKDVRTLLLQFASPVLPSSVHPDLLPLRATVSSLSGKTRIPVLGGSLGDDALTLTLQLQEDLIEGDRYQLTLSDVVGPGPAAAPPGGLVVRFLAELPREGVVRGAAGNPDLDGEGDVDFDDFSLFSLVYNTEYDPVTSESLLSKLKKPAELPPPPPIDLPSLPSQGEPPDASSAGATPPPGAVPLHPQPPPPDAPFGGPVPSTLPTNNPPL